MGKVRVTYSGPADVVNRDVGRATGEGDLLVPGRTYELERELADRLARSSAFFSIDKPARKPKAGKAA